MAAAAEQFSEHPLGKAVVRCYQSEIGADLKAAEQFEMIPGEGVSAIVSGKQIRAGNLKMISGAKGAVRALTASAKKYLNAGSTVIYISVEDVVAGYIVLSDTVRKESRSMIEALHRLGVQPVLLTGDHKNAANAIADQLQIDEVHADCLPEDKLNQIGLLQSSGNAVCMIGDGINDAPALKQADVGIAMGGIGSDITVDAADIALVDDEIKELPHLFLLSRRMMTTIKCNLSFSMGLNFLAIALAITGLLGPVVGALVHNAGSVVVILNSALLLKWNKKHSILSKK